MLGPSTASLLRQLLSSHLEVLLVAPDVVLQQERLLLDKATVLDVQVLQQNLEQHHGQVMVPGCSLPGDGGGGCGGDQSWWSDQ